SKSRAEFGRSRGPRSANGRRVRKNCRIDSRDPAPAPLPRSCTRPLPRHCEVRHTPSDRSAHPASVAACDPPSHWASTADSACPYTLPAPCIRVDAASNSFHTPLHRFHSSPLHLCLPHTPQGDFHHPHPPTLLPPPAPLPHVPAVPLQSLPTQSDNRVL